MRLDRGCQLQTSVVHSRRHQKKAIRPSEKTFSFEAAFDEIRNVAAVVDVGVGENEIVNIGSIIR